MVESLHCADIYSEGQVWKTIVEATSEEYARSLSIWLLMNIRRKRGLDFQKNFKDVFNIANIITTKHTKRIPMFSQLQKGGILLCIPHRTPSNMLNCLPVAKEAWRRRLLTGIVIGGDYEDDLKEFKDNDVPVLSMQELIGTYSSRSAIASWRLAILSYKAMLMAFRQFDQCYTRFLKRNFLSLISATCNSVVLAEACRRLLWDWSPSVIVSSSDFWPFEYQLCHQGSLLGIPSAVIQHGVIGDFWWPFVAKFYLLWGNAFRKGMRQLGAPEDRLKVCGMPASDALFNRPLSHIRPSKAGEATTCLILSQTQARWQEPEIFRNYGKLLAEAVENTGALTWKIKLHPVEDDSFYRELGPNAFHHLEIYPKSVSLETAVSEADVAVTIFSTAGLEAMILQKPLIVLDMSPKVRESAWWPSLGGGVYAHTAHALIECLEHLTIREDQLRVQLDRQKDFLSTCFANQGHAAEAIVDLLKQYVKPSGASLP